MNTDVARWFEELHDILVWTEITNMAGDILTAQVAVDWVRQTIHASHDAGGKLVFIGNGGSAAISSHLAIDYMKNGKLRALAFNDASFLTCLANDLGYANVFAEPIRYHLKKEDTLFAISSSGRSPNIIAAVEAAEEIDSTIVTLSGFDRENDLRTYGHMNFYVSSHVYGMVEVAHLAILHAILDIDMGWKPLPNG